MGGGTGDVKDITIVVRAGFVMITLQVNLAVCCDPYCPVDGGSDDEN